MKDEIKEILDRLKDSVNYPMIDVPTMDGTDSEPMENTVLLEPNESKILLNCITNLQQIEQDHQRINGELREELEDYKLRNEKAIEFNQIVLDSDYVYSQDEIAQKNLNILQGDDKDEK